MRIPNPFSPRSAGAAALLAAIVAASPALAGDLEDAKALRESGKWKEALARYQKAAEADPASAEAALGACEALCALGQY